MIIENVVQMHASWLTVNAIQGCVNNCSYCFMKRFQATNVIPKRIIPHTDVIPYIKESRYYSPDIPICLFSGTDIMATKDNQEYLCQLLDEFERDTMTNPIILITKCKIPNEILRRIASINKKQHVIMYLSYSGLPSTIEPNIDTNAIKNNFIGLSAHNIDIIHYFRPIMPQNSRYEIIDEILSFTSQYAKASVVTGLKIYNGFMSNSICWAELQNIKELEKYECIWPKGAVKDLYAISRKLKYPIFQTNSCALSLVLGEADRYGNYNTDICLNFNNCPDEMRIKCKSNVSNLSRSKSYFEEILSQYSIASYSYDENRNTLQIFSDLDNQDICFISRKLNCHILVNSRNNNFTYWNGGVSNSPQIHI